MFGVKVKSRESMGCRRKIAFFVKEYLLPFALCLLFSISAASVTSASESFETDQRVEFVSMISGQDQINKSLRQDHPNRVDVFLCSRNDVRVTSGGVTRSLFLLYNSLIYYE